MDVAWFKTQQKLAGVTADVIAEKLGRDRSLVSRIYVGRQRMSLDHARVFAEVFQQPVSEVLRRAGINDIDQVDRPAIGFSEGDAAPFTYGPGLAEGHLTRSIAQVMGERPGVDVWRVKSASMALAGFLPGDFVLVDTHAAERVRAGDVVIAQVYSRDGATTLLRRFSPPVLVAASCAIEDQKVHVVDGENVVVRGKVTACWRN